MRTLSARSAALLSLPVYALLVARFDFVCDDAFISFRYARNLARGLGLTYNVGVDPPVEGYSNFLWVLVMAAVEKLGGDVTVWSRVVSIACGTALIYCVVRFVSRRVSDLPAVTLSAAFLMATFPSITVWSTGGLATLPFALAIFGCFERLLGDPDRPRGLETGALALLAALLRADGVYWGVLILVVAAATWMATRNAALLRAALLAAGLLAAGLTVYVYWRHAYHGDWIPNTARVKVGLSAFTLTRGFDYVASYLLSVTSVSAILILTPWALLGRFRAVAAQSAAIVAGTLAYAVVVGGDFMAMGRLLVPAAPLLAVIGAVIVERFASAGRTAASYGLTLALVTLSMLPQLDLHPVPRSLRESFAFRFNLPGYGTEYARWRAMRGNAVRWSLLGRALALHTRPGESIVLDAIGAAGYYGDLFVYDQYGLVDREAASRPLPAGRRSAGHDRFVEPDYFLPLSPTYLGAFLRLGARADPVAAESVPSGYRVETVPLDPSEGFPPDTTLVLIALASR